MIEINLIPDVKRELLKAQRTRGVVISASILTSIVAVGAVVLLLFYMYGVQAIQGSLLDRDIEEKGREFSSIEDLSEVLTIQNQLSSISAYNDQKVMSSRLFDVIAAVTPSGSEVAFSQVNMIPAGEGGSDLMGGTTGGQIRLEGQTPSYDTMEVFKKRIENTSFEFATSGGEEKQLIPIASNISTGDVSYGEDTSGRKVLRFSMSFDYPVELFSSRTANQRIAFKLVLGGNVTDSYLGIPKFAARASDLPEGEE